MDASTFDGFASVIDELRARPDGEALSRAVEFATRAAAIDTGAIEGLYEVDRGFTMTVARGVAAWEKVIAAREPAATELGVAAYQQIGVRVRRPNSEVPVLQLVAVEDTSRLAVELRDTFPEFTAVLRLRIEVWVGGLVSRLVTRLDERVRAALAEHGYR